MPDGWAGRSGHTQHRIRTRLEHGRVEFWCGATGWPTPIHEHADTCERCVIAHAEASQPGGKRR